VGLPLAAGVLSLIHLGLLGNWAVQRYVDHPVENVEVLLCCCALGALAVKFWNYRGERAACGLEVLPPWDGRVVPVAEAEHLSAAAAKIASQRSHTYLVRRVVAVLDFVRARGSAAELDDHLRTLADNDAIALENSYSLIRFITWAIPILGFLGTVLGITGAISGVTPEVLEHSLSTVTDGLALAFDATALALGLTMITMFLSFLMDRAEQAVLLAVDRYADTQLAHRFERIGPEGGEFVQVVRHNTQVLLDATERLVEKQADVWARTFAEIDRQRTEVEGRQQQVLLAALETMLERTLETHTKRLAGLEKQAVQQSGELLGQLAQLTNTLRDTGREQQASLAQVMDGATAQAEALARLHQGAGQLLKLQEVLTQNLSALAGAGSFEQAVHSLTAAVHMLTARTVALPSGNASRIGQRAA
jgi:biopolymer transport protein ExbB/TolQ